MTSMSTTALLVIVGIGAGPYGLNLLSSPVLLLLDPAIAMALAMLGVFVGLNIDARRPRLTTPAVCRSATSRLRERSISSLAAEKRTKKKARRSGP